MSGQQLYLVTGCIASLHNKPEGVSSSRLFLCCLPFWESSAVPFVCILYSDLHYMARNIDS